VVAVHQAQHHDGLAVPGASVGLSRPFPAGSAAAVARREARWALAAQVLGAVLAYDAEHSGDLVASVRVWLEHDRQTERAAQALHIHPNTLLYRIRRFEQISGRSLASTESLAEVWQAMRSTAAVPEG
jgi:PucR family transcriptional regulator, purine catabolism regulatory protein